MHHSTKHGATVVAAFFLMAVLNYAFGVALSWLFPPEEYGVLGVAQSLLLVTALVASSGFAWTANRDIAGGEITEETQRRFRAAWLANTALGVLVAVALWAAYAIGWLPFGPAYREVIPLVGLTTVVLSARAVLNGALRGLSRFGALALNQVSEVVIKAVAGLGLVALGMGAAGVMAGFTIGALLALAHCLWVVRDRRLWHGPGWFDREVLVGTLPLFVGMFGPALMLNLDVLGLKLLSPANLGDELAGYYQAAIILARTPVFVAQALTMVLFSYVAGGKKKGDEEGYMGGALRAWARLLLPIGLTLSLAPEAMLSLFFPPAYLAAAPALRAAAIGGVLLALVTLVSGVAQGAGERRRSTAAALLGVLVQLVVLVWAVPGMGALGAALSLVAAAVVSLLVLLPVALRHLNVEEARASLGAATTELFPLLALMVPLLLLPGNNRTEALLKLVVAGVAYVAALVAPRLPFLVQGRRDVSPERPMGHPLARFVHVLMGG